MLSLILGVLTIGLGAKGFTPTGLPFSKAKNIKGTPARVIGVFCLLLGVIFLVDGVFGTMNLVRRLSGPGR